jgi:cell division protein FtsB
LASEKRKFWKIPLILICFLAPVMAWLGFGEQGLIHLYRTEMERKAYVDRIHQLAEENQTLLEEVHRLQTDMEYIESVARKELSLIKKDEIIYRFDKKETRSEDTGSITKKAQHRDENGRSEREVQHDGKFK